MPRNVILAASFPAAADRLFDMYLDPQTHAAFTGAPVTIEPRAGTPFSAFDGVLTGTMLHIEPKRLIVQTWRSANWPAEAMDSVLTLQADLFGDGPQFEPKLVAGRKRTGGAHGGLRRRVRGDQLASRGPRP